MNAAACSRCDHIHNTTDVRAEGRFQPAGPTGYRATTFDDAPLRLTRAEADADACARRTEPGDQS